MKEYQRRAWQKAAGPAARGAIPQGGGAVPNSVMLGMHHQDGARPITPAVEQHFMHGPAVSPASDAKAPPIYQATPPMSGEGFYERDAQGYEILDKPKERPFYPMDLPPATGLDLHERDAQGYEILDKPIAPPVYQATPPMSGAGFYERDAQGYEILDRPKERPFYPSDPPPAQAALSGAKPDASLAAPAKPSGVKLPKKSLAKRFKGLFRR